MTDYLALKTDIQSGPHAAACATFVGAEDFEGAARYLNAASGGTVYGVVGTNDILTWGAVTGMRAVIQDEAADSTSPLRSSALALLDVMRGAVPSINFANPQILAMLDAWEAAGKCTSESKAALLALASKPVSYSASRFGRDLTDADIREALRS